MQIQQPLTPNGHLFSSVSASEWGGHLTGGDCDVHTFLTCSLSLFFLTPHKHNWKYFEFLILGGSEVPPFQCQTDDTQWRDVRGGWMVPLGVENFFFSYCEWRNWKWCQGQSSKSLVLDLCSSFTSMSKDQFKTHLVDIILFLTTPQKNKVLVFF